LSPLYFEAAISIADMRMNSHPRTALTPYLNGIEGHLSFRLNNFAHIIATLPIEFGIEIFFRYDYRIRS